MSSSDAYVSFLGEQQPARTSRARKIALAALAVLGVVGVVAAVVLIPRGSPSASSLTDVSAARTKLGLLNDSEYEFLFASFVAQHGKTYESEAHRLERFIIFKQNLDMIQQHNAQGYSYELGMNQFGDLTREEFKAQYLGFAMPAKQANPLFVADPAAPLPDSVDWRAKGAVTPVKNQQQCGSCWAFSTTGALEGLAFIKSGKAVSLSEQQLVDCSKAEGNNGCQGGIMDQGFKYVMDNKGLATEDAYPYKAKDGKCQKSAKSAFTITGFQDVAKNDEDALKAAVAQQPVAVAIEADQSGFQFYKSGVFDGACGTNLDHGVLVVGYGTDSGKDYWIVKNSWGASWGDQGYIKFIRHAGKSAGQCGVAMMASFPTA